MKHDEIYLCSRSVRIKTVDPLHGVNVHVTQSHLQSLLITDFPTDVFIKERFQQVTFVSANLYEKQELACLRRSTTLDVNKNE